ncbi:hypothetical protein ACOMHN_046139 [Nucella lapillus]
MGRIDFEESLKAWIIVPPFPSPPATQTLTTSSQPCWLTDSSLLMGQLGVMEQAEQARNCPGQARNCPGQARNCPGQARNCRGNGGRHKTNETVRKADGLKTADVGEDLREAEVSTGRGCRCAPPAGRPLPCSQGLTGPQPGGGEGQGHACRKTGGRATLTDTA